MKEAGPQLSLDLFHGPRVVATESLYPFPQSILSTFERRRPVEQFHHSHFEAVPLQHRTILTHGWEVVVDVAPHRSIDSRDIPLAAHLGYTTRQLERLLQAEVGAGPLALARAQRAQTARTLIETTDLPFGDVAFAAGFSSIRQFNDTVRLVFENTPTSLRERAAARPGSESTSPGTVSLRLPVRTPFAYEGVFGHLAAGTVPGCEEVRDGAYRRSLRLPSGSGVVSLADAVESASRTLASSSASGSRSNPIRRPCGPSRRTMPSACPAIPSVQSA